MKTLPLSVLRLIVLTLLLSVAGSLSAQENTLPDLEAIAEAVANGASTGIGQSGFFGATCLDSSNAPSVDYSGGVLIQIASINGRPPETRYFTLDDIFATIITHSGVVESPDADIEAFWQTRFVIIDSVLYTTYNAPFFGLFYTWACGDPDLITLALNSTGFQFTTAAAPTNTGFIGTSTTVSINGADVTATCLLPALSTPGNSAALASPMMVGVANGGLAFTADNALIGLALTSGQPVDLEINGTTFTVALQTVGDVRRYALGEPVNSAVVCGSSNAEADETSVRTAVESANVRTGVGCFVITTLLQGTPFHPVARVSIEGQAWYLVSRFELILNGAFLVDTENLMQRPYAYIAEQVTTGTLSEEELPTVLIQGDGYVSVCSTSAPEATATPGN